MQQAAAYLTLELYEDSVNLLGVADVTLPTIAYKTVPLNAAGLMGDLNVPLIGMMEAMSMSIKFRTMTQASVNLATPKMLQLDMRVAEEYWISEEAEVSLWADKFVVICQPKNMTPGTVTPSNAADVSSEFEVYYFAAYRDGKQLWEIDKRNQKCVINGVDYMAPVRKALGK